MEQPIRVLRVIARLNVGGPALHVSYLTRGLDRARVRDDARRRAGRYREGSMEYAARELGVEPVFLPDCSATSRPGLTSPRVLGVRDLIRDAPAARPAHPHREGRRGGAHGGGHRAGAATRR